MTSLQMSKYSKTCPSASMGFAVSKKHLIQLNGTLLTIYKVSCDCAILPEKEEKKKTFCLKREKNDPCSCIYPQTSPVLTPNTLQDLPIISNKMCRTVRRKSKLPNLH